MSHHGPSHTDLRVNLNIHDVSHRPTKSAAQRYRHMIGHGDAIQEETDYNTGPNVLISGIFKRSPDEDEDLSMLEGECTKPIGI